MIAAALASEARKLRRPRLLLGIVGACALGLALAGLLVPLTASGTAVASCPPP